MVLCEKSNNPKLGNGLGPWPGGFVLIGGSEAVKNNFPTLILKKKLFTRKINFVQKSRKLQVLQTHAFSHTLVEFVLGSQWEIHGLCSCLVSEDSPKALVAAPV